jgi:hypothetical protein
VTTITPDGALDPGVLPNVVRAPSRRVKAEALSLVLGMLGILLGLALTVGGPLPGGR